MSLINEALKRAEEDKLRKSRHGDEALPMEAVNAPPGSRSGVAVKIVAAVVIVLAVLSVAWMIYGRKLAPFASPSSVAGSATPSRTATDGQASLESPPARVQRPAAVTGNKAQIAALSLSPAAPKAKSQYSFSSIMGSMIQALTGSKADKTAEAGMARKSAAVSPSVAVAGPAGLGASPSTATPFRPAPAAAAAPSPKAAAQPAAPSPPPPLDESKFKLSGVMMGPGGATAIINGQSVTQGETVDGAKVIRVSQHSVDLEVNGRRLTIRM